MLLFKTNTLEFAFGRHIEHMVSYQGMPTELPMFLARVKSALSRFSCKYDCSAKPDFSYVSTWKHQN